VAYQRVLRKLDVAKLKFALGEERRAAFVVEGNAVMDETIGLT
jgi:hypothetical protein